MESIEGGKNGCGRAIATFALGLGTLIIGSATGIGIVAAGVAMYGVIDGAASIEERC